MILPQTGDSTTAVLFSGGLDSAVLLGTLRERFRKVQPLFVRCGLVWESSELQAARRFVEALADPRVKPVVVLEMPATDLYKHHWSVTGIDVPSASSPDEAVFLPGRNLLLMSKAAVWCSLNGYERLAIATLKGNPFRDASPGFCRAFEDMSTMALGGRIAIEQPFANFSKQEVLTMGQPLPLEVTFSCLNPVADSACGNCNKCAERKLAFETVMNMRQDQPAPEPV